jgi:hypothetical protein
MTLQPRISIYIARETLLAGIFYHGIMMVACNGKSQQDSCQATRILLVGIANYWNTTLAKRYFQSPDHVLELEQKIKEVHEIFTQKLVNQTVEKYLPFAKLNCLNDPYYLNVFQTPSALDRGIAAIRSTVEHNYSLYLQNRSDPMPFLLGNPENVEVGLLLYWDASFDLQGDRLSYTLQIATDPGLKIWSMKKDD